MFIYLLRNKAMPRLYKVGFSAEPAVRAASLSAASGVPVPFEVVHTVDCMTERQARRAEAMAHFMLEYSRVSAGREFFDLDHENIGVHAIVVSAFVAWRPDRSPADWQRLASELTAWPIDGAAE